jgi:hypothetical protein
MKYLIDPNSPEWEQSDKKVQRIFRKIRTRFPVEFLCEFDKCWFHDSMIFSVKYISSNEGENPSIIIELQDFAETNLCHQLKFLSVSRFVFDYDLSQAPRHDWGYCEFLPIKGQRLSLEVRKSYGEDSFYLEFERLEYQKHKFEIIFSDSVPE